MTLLATFPLETLETHIEHYISAVYPNKQNHGQQISDRLTSNNQVHLSESFKLLVLVNLLKLLGMSRMKEIIDAITVYSNHPLLFLFVNIGHDF